MYDTSDIRKGLKVLMDGNPYTVIEFQFVKPGKGAAFTRTKFKNLLTGAIFERNIRSGEKLEPANVEERSMQYLYKEGDDLVFMDESTYEQVHVLAEMVGQNSDLMKDNLPVQVLFFNERAVDVTLPTFVVLEGEGAAQFALGPAHDLPSLAVRLLAGDLNGDGKTDLVAATFPNGSITVLLAQ